MTPLPDQPHCTVSDLRIYWVPGFTGVSRVSTAMVRIMISVRIRVRFSFNGAKL